MTEALPESMSPWLTVTLEGLRSIIRGSGSYNTPPVGENRVVTIALTPNVPSGTVLRVDTVGYLPEAYVWKVGPIGTMDADQTWPFSDQILDLADPDVLTDATEYKVDILVEASGTSSAVSLTGTLTCPGVGGTIDLLSTLKLSATNRLSSVVKGVGVQSASIDEFGELTLVLTDGTTLDPVTVPAGPVGPANTLTIGTVTTEAAGNPATATITGDAPNQTLNLGIPQGEVGYLSVIDNGDGTPTIDGNVLTNNGDGTITIG